MHLRNNIYPVRLRIQFVALIQPLTGWSSGFDFRNLVFVTMGDKGFVQGRHRYFQAIHAGNLKPWAHSVSVLCAALLGATSQSHYTH